MSKIVRKTALLFGSSSGASQIAKFGSLAASSIAYSTDPAVIQSLSAWLTGWFGAIVGANSPAIEDMNAFCYVMAYQISYLMQAGIAEWDSGTTYYIGSMVNSSGAIYVSKTDTNLNHAVTDTTNWKPLSTNIVTVNPSTQSPYTLTSTDIGTTFLVQSSNAAMQFNLPAPVANFYFNVVDRDGNFLNNNCTIHRNAAEKIEGLAADFVMQASYGNWGIVGDGTNWFFRSK